VNSVILIGSAATDPELRYTPNGKPVTSFRLGVPSGRKTKTDKEIVDYFTITTWGDLAERVGENLNKGDRAFVQGRLSNESWMGQDGKKRWVTKITATSVDVLSSKITGAEETGNGGSSDARDIDPDDIPF